MDSPTAAVGEDLNIHSSNLLWTPEIEKTIENWRQTGEFPFPELPLFLKPEWNLLSKVDLRLVHHVMQICCEVNRSRTSKVTIWTDLMPR